LYYKYAVFKVNNNVLDKSALKWYCSDSQWKFHWLRLAPQTMQMG